MKALTTCILLVVTGCNITKIPTPSITNTTVSRSEAYDLEIRELLKIDADNKKWERIYLQEIRIAQKNDDHDAYKFFIKEYISIPRLILPKWMHSEPGYVPGVTIEEIEENRGK